MTRLLGATAAAVTIACLAISFSNGLARAQQGYEFKPVLAHKNVSRDPDGLWDPGEFQPFGNPPHLPSLYTASLTTPAGEWIVSMIDSECSLQSTCQFILALRKPDGSVVKMGTGSLLMGGTATLSQNYKKIVTEEIDEDQKAIRGSYDVGPQK